MAGSSARGSTFAWRLCRSHAARRYISTYWPNGTAAVPLGLTQTLGTTAIVHKFDHCLLLDRLCGLVVEFLTTDPEVPGLIPDPARFSENEVHSASRGQLRSYLNKKVAAPV
jgi:hypothetical protein